MAKQPPRSQGEAGGGITGVLSGQNSALKKTRLQAINVSNIA
jgi:hypothetical protein